MFSGAVAFNQPLNFWNTSRVIDMSSMFAGTFAFNQPLNNWTVSNVTRDGLNFMFNGASVFNANISHWNAVNVNSSNPAIGFRRNSPLIDSFTPLAIRDATGGGR
jgi:surface protein